MSFPSGDPRVTGDWLPFSELGPDDAPASHSQLKMRKGYKGKPGPYYKEARRVFGAHFDHLARTMRQFKLHKLKPMYPPELTEAQKLLKPKPDRIEQTPFGPVIANLSTQNDLNYLNTENVSFIETDDAHYKNPAAKPTDPPPEGSKTYVQLAKRLTSKDGPEMAHEILKQVYSTLALRSEGETDPDRQVGCMALQASYAEHWEPEQRRTMAVLYALAILSEDQRTAGVKPMCSALRLIADERMTPEQAFVAHGVSGPAFVQAKAKDKKDRSDLGGMELTRFTGRGGQRSSKDQELLYGNESSSSDGEEEPKTKAPHYWAQVDRERKDEVEIEVDKLRAKKRAAGKSTRNVKGTDYFAEALALRGERDESATQGRKRRLAVARTDDSSRPAKLRRLLNDADPKVPRAEQTSVGAIRKSRRLATAKATVTRGANKRKALAEETPPAVKSRAKRQRLKGTFG